MTRYLAIKNFRKHQHYHHRGAPWIKLYASILNDGAFLQLPEAAQSQIVKLWVLASQMGHPLPNDPKLLAGKIGTTGRFHLAAIIAAGFLVPCDDAGEPLLAESEQNASKPLAKSEQDVGVLAGARGEREKELERELSVSPQAAALESELAALLTADADRVALTAVLAKSRSRGPCAAALRAILTGNDPAVPPLTPEQFGVALRDFAANAETWNAAYFRGYIRRAVAPPTPTRQPPGPRANTIETGRANLFAAVERRERERAAAGETDGE